MLDHAFGFFAVREGGDSHPMARMSARSRKDRQSRPEGRRTVVLRNGLYTLDGQDRTDLELTESLKTARGADPTTWVRLTRRRR